MQTNHCMTKVHLHKIHVKEDQFCECDKYRRFINHTYFLLAYKHLAKHGIIQVTRMWTTAPFGNKVVISKPNNKIIRVILKFKNINKIML